jgi:hypothetical protein
MRPVVVHARAGVPPRGVQDLSTGSGVPLDQASLVVAGQALTWQSAFTSGPITAIPLTVASAVLFADASGPDQWHDRFARGVAHRMAGELAIASVTAGLLGGEAGEDAELLGSAIDGLTRLLIDIERLQAPEQADGSDHQIVADAATTHAALLGTLTDQRISVREHGEFAVHTVRSVSADLGRGDLQRVLVRVGLPWPTHSEAGVGRDLGLARWRATFQAHGHQMWCRVDENALVTELWLRDPR